MVDCDPPGSKSNSEVIKVLLETLGCELRICITSQYGSVICECGDDGVMSGGDIVCKKEGIIGCPVPYLGGLRSVWERLWSIRVVQFPFPPSQEVTETSHDNVTETLVFFLPGRATDLSAPPLYGSKLFYHPPFWGTEGFKKLR
jgi:hypothetical protein